MVKHDKLWESPKGADDGRKETMDRQVSPMGWRRRYNQWN